MQVNIQEGKGLKQRKVPNMKEHPHLHCIMPTGGLSFDREHWVHIPDKNNYFIAGKVLAKKFRGKFLYMLKQSKEKGELCFHGNLAGIKGPVQFNRFLTLKKGSRKINLLPFFTAQLCLNS
jgi:hypothetical protein